MYTYGTIHICTQKILLSFFILSIHIIFYLPIYSLSIDPFFFGFQMPLGKAMLHWSSMPVAEEAAVVTPVGKPRGEAFEASNLLIPL